jgi:Tfp pilus assembly major pilin PilA
MLGQDIIINPPEPEPEAETYRIELTTEINPELPPELIDRMRTSLSSGGWSFIDIAPSENGYTAVVEKQGSVTLTIMIIVGIIGILAIIGVIVKDYKAIKQSNNAVTSQAIVSKTDAINKVMESVNQGMITSAEAENLINYINTAYATETQSDDSLGTDLKDAVKLLVYGSVAVAGINMLSKR